MIFPAYARISEAQNLSMSRSRFGENRPLGLVNFGIGPGGPQTKWLLVIGTATRREISRLFREMASGDRYPQALVIAHRLFLAYLDEQRVRFRLSVAP